MSASTYTNEHGRTIPIRKRCPHCGGAFEICLTFTKRVGLRLAHGFTMRQALRSAHFELLKEPHHG